MPHRHSPPSCLFRTKEALSSPITYSCIFQNCTGTGGYYTTLPKERLMDTGLEKLRSFAAGCGHLGICPLLRELTS